MMLRASGTESEPSSDNSKKCHNVSEIEVEVPASGTGTETETSVESEPSSNSTSEKHPDMSGPTKGSDDEMIVNDQGPARGGSVWEGSLRQKPPVRTMFQAGKGTSDGKKDQSVKDTSGKSSSKGRAAPRSHTYQDGRGFLASELVWGRLKLKKGWAWWPGMVTPWHRTLPGLSGFRRVEWFGDGMYSEMFVGALLAFSAFNKCFSKTYFDDLPLYRDAIYQIIELAAQRSSKSFSEAGGSKDKELRSMVDWATGGFLPGGPAAFTVPSGSTGTESDSDCQSNVLSTRKKHTVTDSSVPAKGSENDRSVKDQGPHRVYPSIPHQERKPLKVMSLFEGTATGYHKLKRLGFKTERYIDSEISGGLIPGALEMVKRGHIEHVKDVRTITRKHVAEWGPFDLLIGGIPCNEGLYGGTGRLFFEFYRILTMLRPREDDERPFFWLFENVVFMAANDKADICRLLECDPIFMDAVKGSPAHTARYLWGNLPGMNRISRLGNSQTQEVLFAPLKDYFDVDV